MLWKYSVSPGLLAITSLAVGVAGGNPSIRPIGEGAAVPSVSGPQGLCSIDSDGTVSGNSKLCEVDSEEVLSPYAGKRSNTTSKQSGDLNAVLTDDADELPNLSDTKIASVYSEGSESVDTEATGALSENSVSEKGTPSTTDSEQGTPPTTVSEHPSQDIGAELGWSTDHVYDFMLRDQDRCDFEKVDMKDVISGKVHLDWSRPYIIENYDLNSEAKGGENSIGYKTSKASMLKNFGEKRVILSNAITHSHDKRRCSFREYIHTDMVPPSLEDALAMDARNTWYLCGDNFWDELLQAYVRPDWLPNAHNGSLAFGVGRSGSGIPLHRHGGALLEVTAGRKRWFVVPPLDSSTGANDEGHNEPSAKYQLDFGKVSVHPGIRREDPPFDPNVSSFKWFYNHEDKLADRLQMCTQEAGQALWLPDMWWHSTLNIGDCVFWLLFT